MNKHHMMEQYFACCTSISRKPCAMWKVPSLSVVISRAFLKGNLRIVIKSLSEHRQTCDTFWEVAQRLDIFETIFFSTRNVKTSVVSVRNTYNPFCRCIYGLVHVQKRHDFLSDHYFADCTTISVFPRGNGPKTTPYQATVAVYYPYIVVASGALFFAGTCKGQLTFHSFCEHFPSGIITHKIIRSFLWLELTREW